LVGGDAKPITEIFNMERLYDFYPRLAGIAMEKTNLFSTIFQTKLSCF
jgi:hypothetical protein